MNERGPIKFTYDLTHSYLEVARGAMTTIHHPSGTFDSVFAKNLNPFANATMALASISIIYSFMSIESFVNYQLFRIWERRSDNSAEAKRFIDEFGDNLAFEKLKSHPRARELPERLKTLCRVLNYAAPHDTIPDTWRRLNELVDASRHFFIHPYPDPAYFHSNMDRIVNEIQAGAYVKVVEETLQYLYEKSKKQTPTWLAKNTLLRFRGVDLLVPDSGSSQN